MAEEPIRVVVVDDEDLVRDALAEVVASDPGLLLEGVAGDTDEALALLERVGPDVAVVDVRMPGGGGLRLVREVAARRLATRVICHSGMDDRATVVQMLDAGAVGFLLKGTRPADIRAAIRDAVQGRPAVSAEVVAGLVRDLSTVIGREVEQTEQRRARLDRVIAAVAGEGRSTVVQPIVELDGRRVVGVEALARFALEPARTPDRWFDEAWELGLGLELELACAADALVAMERLPAALTVSLNASHRAATSPELRELLERFAPDRTVLEITEHEPVADYASLTGALDDLRALGVRVAIDDAGAGFASLRHILELRPEIIKLDIGLTRGVDRDRAHRALARALISFADETGTTVIAEGVETEEERLALLELGVRLGQGFHLGRPGPVEDLALR